MENKTYVGICGFAQSGKDTLATQLRTRLGFEVRAFGDALRGMLYDINPVVDWGGFSRSRRIQEIVDLIGWEDAKKIYPEVRELLQRLGTEGGRRHIGEDVWVRSLFEKPHSSMLVIPDVRFPNEALAIKERGGVVVRIVRAGNSPVNAHVSETAYSDQDFVIENNGSPEDLFRSFIESLHVFWGGLRPPFVELLPK
jgi:hypothetical protein